LSSPDFAFVKASRAYAEIQNQFPKIRILSFSKCAGSFKLDGFGVLSSRQLSDWFANIDGRFVANLGGVKSKNVSSNDVFTDWTPKFLTRDCVINDIDALLCPRSGNSGVLVELKRPKIDIRYWGPYVDDYGNYESSAGIANMYRLDNRTIAYNVNRVNFVRLHTNVRWDKTNSSLVSQYAILAPALAITAPLSNAVLMSSHRSKNSTARALTIG
jgi:hypothetical protein